MRAIRNRLFVTFENDLPFIDKIETEGGTIYVDGRMRVEHNANSVGEVYSSSVKGIEKGMKIGVHYQVANDYKWVGDTRVWNNIIEHDGRKLFLIEERHILCTFVCGEPIPYKDWVFMKTIEAEKNSGGLYVYEGVHTRMGNYAKSGCASFYSGDIKTDRGAEVIFDESVRSEYDFGKYGQYLVMPTNLIKAVNNGKQKVRVTQKDSCI